MSEPAASATSRAARRDTLLLLILLVGALVHLVVMHPELPDLVPSHFDAHGVPDAWMTKDGFVTMMALVYAVFGGLFLLLVQFLPRIPIWMINLPNKAYWLAPERREVSLAELGRRLARFGAVTIVMVLGLTHEMLLVARGEKQTADAFIIVVAVYGFFTVFWCIALLKRFGRRPVKPLTD